MIKDVSNRIKHENTKFDVLGDVLETLRFRGSIFFRSNLAAPWGMSFDNTKNPRFHIALAGDFFVGHNTKDSEATHINHMEVIMLPQGGPHWIADKTNRQLTPTSMAGEACELGTPLFQQGEFTHELVCGVVNYDDQIFHPILDALPAILHFSNIQADDPIWKVITLIDKEMSEQSIGQPSIVDRLTEVLFLKLLGQHALDGTEATGFFSAFHNHRVYQALKLIHQFPEKQWSLKLLGESLGMSRATLTRQFNSTVGTPPMTYIANWRMAKAFHLLKHSSDTVDQIADKVGFSTPLRFYAQ
ncbi:AraC family transcriptional regulator [Methyloprofundus sp.]|uniref:AraC family transcriptional regulator n=1 Tax=Methyloprofundus sp. TaxID=2020875 RepID=UPI003D104E9A